MVHGPSAGSRLHPTTLAIGVLAILQDLTTAPAELLSFYPGINIDPNSAEAHLNLGIALADARNLDGALVEFTEAVRLSPDSASAHYNRGRMLMDLRRFAAARTELQKSTELDPKASSAFYLLAIAEKQFGNR